MTPAEFDTFVEEKLGWTRRAVKVELDVLADRLRPDERILTLAVAGPALIGGPHLLAATDQRLLLLWPSSQCEELEYGSLVSVSDDSSAGAIALVTQRDVHALTISPPARAAEIIAAVAACIGHDQIHPAAGAAIARRSHCTVHAGGAPTRR